VLAAEYNSCGPGRHNIIANVPVRLTDDQFAALQSRLVPLLNANPLVASDVTVTFLLYFHILTIMPNRLWSDFNFYTALPVLPNCGMVQPILSVSVRPVSLKRKARATSKFGGNHILGHLFNSQQDVVDNPNFGQNGQRSSLQGPVVISNRRRRPLTDNKICSGHSSNVF